MKKLVSTALLLLSSLFIPQLIQAQDIQQIVEIPDSIENVDTDIVAVTDSSVTIVDEDLASAQFGDLNRWVTPYALPYSFHSTGQNWHRMWINTAVLSTAFVGTLFVLEMLPEGATNWNRAQLSKVPLFRRWYDHVIKEGPEFDGDNAMFNYILHPYAGAAYFMAARSCGFSFWGSMLYSAAISTIGWEVGIEAFMERPSYQDLIITPVVGSILGELMYRGKRTIVDHGYEMLGSPVLGHIACFVLDPVNEVIDLFRGNPARDVARRNRAYTRPTSSLALTPRSLALTITF